MSLRTVPSVTSSSRASPEIPLSASRPRTRSTNPVVEAEINDYPVLPGDVYLLCSDGLNDMVEDEEIQLTLQMLAANLELAATQLIQMANDNGGRDNVSVILVKVLSKFPAARSWWSKFLAWFR